MMSQYSGEGANSEKKYFQMRFFLHFAIKLTLSILTIGANIGSCPRTTPPLPHGFFISRHFRALRPHAGLERLFFIICGHESSARSQCVYLQRR